MPSPRLRVTERCLVEDLGLKRDLAKKDARDFQDLHPAVQKFVTMRGSAPDGAEPVHGPYKRGVIGSLHVGSARGVTRWDSSEDVCWLLGYNEFHRNGDPDDAFNVFNRQYEAGVLLPTEHDYLELLKEPDDRFLDMLRESGRQLMERARANNGHEEIETYHDGGNQVICIDAVVEADDRAEEGWIGLTLPADEFLSNDEVYDVVASLLPEEVTPIYEHEKFRDRPRHKEEIVYRWEHYEIGGSGGGAEPQ